MAITGAAIAAKQSGGNPVKRVGAYVKAHWKELLALVLAAIPALFIVFHSGARKSAQSILTLPPLGANVAAGGADPSSAITPPVATTPAASDPFSVLGRTVRPSPAKPPNFGKPTFGGSDAGGRAVNPSPATSVNGYNPISVDAPDLSSAAGVPPSRVVRPSVKP